MKITFSILRDDGQTPKSYSVSGDTIVFGRSEDCSVVLASELVSTRHASLETMSDGFHLRDLGSTNGTFVDGVKVTVPVELRDLSTIEFGRSGPRLRILSLNVAETGVSPAGNSIPVPTDPDVHDDHRNSNRLSRGIAVAAVCFAVLAMLVSFWLPSATSTSASGNRDAGGTPLDVVGLNADERLVLNAEPSDFASLQEAGQATANTAGVRMATREKASTREAGTAEGNSTAVSDRPVTKVDGVQVDPDNPELSELTLLTEQRIASREDLRDARRLKEWAHQRFDEPLTGTQVANFSERVARAHTLRQNILSQLVNLPSSANSGKIWSGSGLNDLLDHLGPVAFQHYHWMEEFRQPTRSPDETESQRMAYLSGLSDSLRIPRAQLEGIECQRGLTGPVISVKLGVGETFETEFIPLDWPTWFRLHVEFRESMDRVATARDACLAAPKTDEISAAVELQDSVDQIEQLFSRAQRTHFAKLSTGVTEDNRNRLATETRQLQRARAFLRTLRHSVARFLEMGKVPDKSQYSVVPEDSDDARGTSVITLLAAMHERGLRFAEASAGTEVERQMIFERMRDYYVDLYSLYTSIQHAERDMEEVNAAIQRVHSEQALHMLWGWMSEHVFYRRYYRYN